MLNTRLLSISCWNKYTERPELTGKERYEQNLALILESLDRAESFNPDFIVLPEIVLHVGVAETADALPWAEEIPGRAVNSVAERAIKLNSHILFPLFEQKDGKLFNSVVLIGRDGEVLGVYRKYHATGYEIEEGVTPGEDIPVWDTDCGKAGCAVCFDLEYDDVPLALARGGAKMVFWPTMFPGGRRMNGWALTHGFYMIKSGGAHGEIIDPLGNTIATDMPLTVLPDNEGQLRFTFAEVNTDFRVYHPDFNRDKFEEIKRRYSDGVSITAADPEARVVIASNMEDVTAADIGKEFGLVELRDYLDSAEEIRSRKV
jgi:predicted amidohydrolase